MNDVTLTIAKQINAKELNFARFKLMTDDEKNGVIIGKGKRFFRIYYDSGSDLYNVVAGRLKGYTDEVLDVDLKGVYSDQLQGMIQDHFPTFEYVMESLRLRKTQDINFTRGVNC